MEVEIDSLFEGWSTVLATFQTEQAVRISSRHGVTFDIPGLSIILKRPDDTRIPNNYPLPEIVKDYRERLFGNQQSNSLLYQRLTDWKPSKGSRTRVNQLETTMDSLRRNQNSRAAVFSVWNPIEDVSSEHPVSPVSGCFRILGDELQLMVVARSIDVWTGLVPEILAFSQLLTDAAVELGFRHSTLKYYAFSAHVYEADFIQNIHRQQE